jgi:hypothetical protein
LETSGRSLIQEFRYGRKGTSAWEGRLLGSQRVPTLIEQDCSAQLLDIAQGSIPSTSPYGSRRLRLPGILDNRHMNVARLSALRTGSLYSSLDTPVTHFCLRLSRTYSRGARVRIKSTKNPVTPSGIEPATFRLEAQWRTKSSNYSKERASARNWPQQEQKGTVYLRLVSSSLLGTFQVCGWIKELFVATEAPKYLQLYNEWMNECGNRETDDRWYKVAAPIHSTGGKIGIFPGHA